MAYQAYPHYPSQPQPQLQQGGYYPPPPPQMHAPQPVDSFRGYYADRLRQLTFNSRPIIQDLSMMAMTQRDQNDWNGMRVVVEEIEAAVLRAPSHQKLPLLYLLDSISKNIGQPYTTHLLPGIIPRLYIKTYREVDGVTKAKMEEMIALWRTSGVNGSELYGAGVRESVEREIYGSSNFQSQSQSQRPMPPSATMGVGAPSRQQVLSALQTTLESKHRESASNPNDFALSQQVGVLVRIGQLLNSSNVSPQELVQIMNQLKAMAPPPPPLPPPVSAWSPQPQPNPPVPSLLPTYPPATTGYNSLAAPAPMARPPFPPGPGGLTPQPPSSISTPLHHPGSSTPLAIPAPAPVPTAIAPIIPVDVADILRKLTSSGVTSQPLTPELKPAEIASTQPPQSSLSAYEDLILNMNVALDSLDLNAVHVLSFSHLPQRCKQCGMRFPGLADGENKMQAHLDWHFRRNRKERESGGRGAHRRWLPSAEEWITDMPDNVAGPSNTANSSSPSKNKNSKINGNGEITKEELARLREKWVVVPSESGGNSNAVKSSGRCPICKEVFKAEWSDEEEEWVYRNAVNVNGTIYHATCRAEARIQKTKLKSLDPRGRTSLSRGRTTSGSPGTGTTPQPPVPSHLSNEIHPHPQPSPDVPATSLPLPQARSQSQTMEMNKRKGFELEDGDGEGEAKRVKVELEERVEENQGQSEVASNDEMNGIQVQVTGEGEGEAQLEDIVSGNPGETMSVTGSGGNGEREQEEEGDQIAVQL